MLRLIVLLIFLFIVVNLVVALVSMVRNKKDSDATVKALTYRIVASLVLFVIVVAITIITNN